MCVTKVVIDPEIQLIISEKGDSLTAKLSENIFLPNLFMIYLLMFMVNV